MVGHTKFCLTVLGGFIFFHDPLQVLQLCGIFLTFSGECWCSYCFGSQSHVPVHYEAEDHGQSQQPAKDVYVLLRGTLLC